MLDDPLSYEDDLDDDELQTIAEEVMVIGWDHLLREPPESHREGRPLSSDAVPGGTAMPF